MIRAKRAVPVGLALLAMFTTSLATAPAQAVEPAAPRAVADSWANSTCLPSFCSSTFADMKGLGQNPNQIPITQRASTAINPSLAQNFTTPRLFGAVDEQGNTTVTGWNDQTAFQGAGDSGNIYNFTQWPYLGMIYYYSHSAMAVPPVAWINAAHRNGVPIVGVLTGDCDDCADADNSFFAQGGPVAAAQLAAIANTAGFDGWLFDIENGVNLNDARPVMQAMRDMSGPSGAPLIGLYYEAGAYTLSPGATNDAFKAAGYWQSDYGTGSPATSNATVLANAAPNNNPLKTSYARYVYQSQSSSPCSGNTSSATGIFNGSANCLDTAGLFDGLAAIRKNDGSYFQSPSLYAVGWERWGGGNLNNTATRAQVQQAHRDLFVGFGASSSDAICLPTPSAPNSVAAFVDPAGVELGAPFVTRFNTGEGDTFQINGTTGAATPWNGIGLQDVQPTWLCAQGAGQTASVNYAESYDGGSSLTVNGNGTVSLFKTQMPLPTSATAVARYKGSTAPLASVRDIDGVWHTASQSSSTTANGWTTSIQSFGALHGDVGEIGVVTGAGTTTIGELAIMSAADYSATPDYLMSIPSPADTGSTFSWSNPAGTWYSNVYGCDSTLALPELLGRTYQTEFDPKYTLQQPTQAVQSFGNYVVQPVNQAGNSRASVSCSPPSVTTGTASTSGTTAMLNATITARGATTSGSFTYATSAELAGGTTVLTTPPTAAGEGATAVSASLTGLSPGTTYYYRANADNQQFAPALGSTQQFTVAASATRQTLGPRCSGAAPQQVRSKGVTVIVPKQCQTTAGNFLRVTGRLLSLAPRGDIRVFTVKRGSRGQWTVRTYGRTARFRLIYSAPAEPGFLSLRITRTYRV